VRLTTALFRFNPAFDRYRQSSRKFSRYQSPILWRHRASDYRNRRAHQTI
jgi:hypothetical protein